MIYAKCIKKFRNKQNIIYGYRLQDLNNQTQDVTPEDLKRAIQNNHINVINLTLTSDGRLVDKKPEKQLKNTKLMPNKVEKSQEINNKQSVSVKTLSDKKDIRPYEADSYSEFIKRLTKLMEETFEFKDKEKLNFGSFSIDPNTREITWLSGTMGDFIYKSNKCYIEIDYTYNVDTKDGVILFDIMIKDGDASPQHTFKYEFDSLNMKAHFSKILKETQQFIYHVKNNWEHI